MEEVQANLKAKGYKTTKYREALLKLFYSAAYPISVPEIMEDLAKEGLEPNKTTVYREMETLLREEIVVEIEFGDGKKRYERANLPHHHHLVCRVCHRVEDVEVDVDIAAVEKRIGKEHGFEEVKHTIEFFGVCESCIG
ncbi:MAG: transcriptional repressor [Patescibacteria group bacterium]|nr:MAG: transcriptional repressor [Patescibacteria group bacterium]